MTKLPQSETIAVDYVNLSMHWQEIRQKKWLIVMISIVMCLLCLSYALLKSKTYQASVLLQIHHNQESSLGSIAHSGQETDKVNLMVEPTAVQIALIRSKFILGPVVQSLHLDIQKKLPEWQVINQIRSHLTITDLAGMTENSSDKPGILQLTLTGDNARDIIQLINRIALTTQIKDRERKSMEATKTLEFLYQQLPIIQNSLKDAEIRLNRYRVKSGRADTASQTRYLFSHLSDLDKQLEAMRTKKIELAEQYTSLHPYRIALENARRELEKQRAEVFSEINVLTATDQVSVNLTRDIAVKKNLYMLLLNKIHEQQVITAGVVSDIGILALATSFEPSASLKVSTITLAGALLGLIIGSLGVLVWQIVTRPKAHLHWENDHYNRQNQEMRSYDKVVN